MVNTEKPMKNKMHKSDKIIMLFGIAFMLSLMFYLLGSRSDGIFSTAVVKSMQAVESADEMSSDVIFKVELKFTAGEHKGKVMVADHYESPGSIYNLQISPGDTVLAVVDEQSDFTIVGIDELYKSNSMMILSIVVMVSILLIAGVNGVKAMLALCFTLLIIFVIMARMLMAGWPAIITTIICSIMIAFINIAFIAGKTKKAFIAFIGTTLGVMFAGIFGIIATYLMRLSGYTGSESTYLQMLNTEINLQGILISGIIIGSLGAVMDVAISISSSVLEISLANPDYKGHQLFDSGMNIGRDIIGTMVNTLILAYTGASLGLILLFSMQREDFPLIKIMNMEFIGAEVVRSLAGLFGMILAIPITAFVASRIYCKNHNKQTD